MKRFSDLCLVLAAVSLTAATSALASPQASEEAAMAPLVQIQPDPEAAVIDEVVVTARRAGLPIWQIEKEGSTVILIGAIGGVPRDFEWRAEALEAATVKSQRILYPAVGQASFSDVLRLIWRIRTVARLPNGTTTADYLSPELQARLEAVMADERNDNWRTRSFVSLGFDLMEKAGYERRDRGAVDAVRRAARSARVPGEPVGTFRGDEMIENLISLPPQTYLPCVAAAIAAAEAGPEGARARLEAWRSLQPAEVLASPLDKAVNLCWPSGDPEIAPQLRAQWAEAARAVLSEPGVTLGVTSLRLLAEPGGVLDQLEAQGLEVVGPNWKPAPEAQ
jgi:uncharacterized protein YbaP (TraB family)